MPLSIFYYINTGLHVTAFYAVLKDYLIYVWLHSLDFDFTFQPSRRLGIYIRDSAYIVHVIREKMMLDCGCVGML